MKNRQRGFIALISTVIIAAILLIFVAEVGMSSFFARFDSLGNENKEQARVLASSCVQIALLALASSSSYSATDQEIDIGTDQNGKEETCVIQSVIRSGDAVTINAYASSNDSYMNVSTHTTVQN